MATFKLERSDEIQPLALKPVSAPQQSPDVEGLTVQNSKLVRNQADMAKQMEEMREMMDHILAQPSVVTVALELKLQ
eukprot:SAG11_NODE_256_length_11566_cov_9.727915_1_plen_77_part_00